MLKRSATPLPDLQAAFVREATAPDLAVPFSEYLSQVRQSAAPGSADGITLAPDTAVQVLRAGALFGGVLTATSRTELLKLAESGSEDARLALREIFGGRAIYPGTFDPFTLGHSDVARRAAKLFDEVVVAVGVNPGKKPLFSVEERLELIRADLHDLGSKIRVVSFEGSLVSAAREFGCDVALRGIRSVTDYEQELQLALVNLTLSKGTVETLFIPAKDGSSCVSSSVVKAVVKVDEDASTMVCPAVLQALHEKRRQGLL